MVAPNTAGASLKDAMTSTTRVSNVGCSTQDPKSISSLGMAFAHTLIVTLIGRQCNYASCDAVSVTLGGKFQVEYNEEAGTRETNMAGSHKLASRQLLLAQGLHTPASLWESGLGKPQC
eukprot:1141979-Pelagomonas_calceolata.AAC.2